MRTPVVGTRFAKPSFVELNGFAKMYHKLQKKSKPKTGRSLVTVCLMAEITTTVPAYELIQNSGLSIFIIFFLSTQYWAQHTSNMRSYLASGDKLIPRKARTKIRTNQKMVNKWNYARGV